MRNMDMPAHTIPASCDSASADILHVHASQNILRPQNNSSLELPVRPFYVISFLGRLRTRVRSKYPPAPVTAFRPLSAPRASIFGSSIVLLLWFALLSSSGARLHPCLPPPFSPATAQRPCFALPNGILSPWGLPRLRLSSLSSSFCSPLSSWIEPPPLSPPGTPDLIRLYPRGRLPPVSHPPL
jgi:hypothetical protein